MARNLRTNTYKDLNEHPEDSILLAYLRGQELENRSNIIQHIEILRCPACLQKLDEQRQVSATLDVLGEMRSYQHYPELSVAGTYARIQSAVNHRIPAEASKNGMHYQQSPRRSAMRLISVPAALGLAILFTMLVFANLSGWSSFNPFSSAGGTRTGQNTSTIVVQPHSTPTPKAFATATVNSTPDKTSGMKGPYIRVCSTKADLAELRLVICGFHFDSTHKANLIAFVPGKGLIFYRNIGVEKDGKFRISWYTGDCKNVPTFIYSYEETSSKPIIVKLFITKFGSCPALTPPPVEKASVFLPNIGQ